VARIPDLVFSIGFLEQVAVSQGTQSAKRGSKTLLLRDNLESPFSNKINIQCIEFIIVRELQANQRNRKSLQISMPRYEAACQVSQEKKIPKKERLHFFCSKLISKGNARVPLESKSGDVLPR
jgi:hypothetical protein